MVVTTTASARRRGGVGEQLEIDLVRAPRGELAS